MSKTLEFQTMHSVGSNNLSLKYHTVLGDNINTMKTTFELNFDLYQAFKQHGYTKIWKQREAVNSKSFFLITCQWSTCNSFC